MNWLPSLPAPRSNTGNMAHFPLLTAIGGQPSFTDVPSRSIFFISIEMAHNKGVIGGYPDNTFHATSPLAAVVRLFNGSNDM